MIYSITGKPSMIDENSLAVSSGAIAYEVVCSTNTVYNLAKKKEDVTLLTYLYVREDEMRLFGFENMMEKSLFLNLISVSGIGPKMGMAILSGINAQTLAVAISSGDVRLLSSIKGLGKKTAERIVLELKDKLASETLPIENMGAVLPMTSSPEITDALETLVLLGVSKQDASVAIKTVAKEGMTAEEIVKLAITKV